MQEVEGRDAGEHLPGCPELDRNLERRERAEPEHVIEVEMREDDVQPLDAVEELGIGDEPASAGAAVDQQGLGVGPDVEAADLAPVRRQPAATPEETCLQRRGYSAVSICAFWSRPE